MAVLEKNLDVKWTNVCQEFYGTIHRENSRTHVAKCLLGLQNAVKGAEPNKGHACGAVGCMQWVGRRKVHIREALRVAGVCKMPVDWRLRWYCGGL